MAEGISLKHWLERWSHLTSATDRKRPRVVVIDTGTRLDGWPGLRVYFEPALEPDQGWRAIEVETHAEAVETAQIMAAGDLTIEDRTIGGAA